MVGRLVSFSNGPFSGDMLIFGGVFFFFFWGGGRGLFPGLLFFFTSQMDASPPLKNSLEGLLYMYFYTMKSRSHKSYILII